MWVVAAAGQQAYADAIGFCFTLAGVIDLKLCGQTHAAHHDGTGGIAAAGHACGNGQTQGGQHGGQRRLLCGFGGARQVVLSDVGDFMGDHTRHLTLIFSQHDQAGEHAYHPSRGGKGINTGVAQHKKAEIPAVSSGVGDQPIAHVFHVVDNDRVFNQHANGTEVAFHIACKGALVLRREHARRGAAHLRQLRRLLSRYNGSIDQHTTDQAETN